MRFAVRIFFSRSLLNLASKLSCHCSGMSSTSSAMYFAASSTSEERIGFHPFPERSPLLVGQSIVFSVRFWLGANPPPVTLSSYYVRPLPARTKYIKKAPFMSFMSTRLIPSKRVLTIRRKDPRIFIGSRW